MKKKRVLASLLALWIVLLVPLCALADIPTEPMKAFYVNDFADVISAEDEEAMIALGEALEDACGAQVVAVTVTFLDGMDIEEYSYQLFQKWKIGQAEAKNGVLTLLSVGDREIWSMVGEGLEEKLPASTVTAYIDDYAIPYFLENDQPKKNITNDDYSKAMLANYQALCQRVASIYGVKLTPTSQSGESYDYAYGNNNSYSSEGISIMEVLIGIIVLVIIFSIIGSIFRSAGNASGCLFGWMLGRGSSRHNRWHRRPPPPPPFMGGGPRHRPPGGRSSGNFGGGGFGGGFGGGSRPSGGGRSGGGRVGGGGSTRGGGGGRKF